MTIAVGDRLPSITLPVVSGETVEQKDIAELLGSGTAVLFGVPGAFTPTCSDYHLPGFVIRSEDLKAKGVSTIACISVNDAFVMSAWGKTQNTGEDVILIADGNGDFARAAGLSVELNAFGLGLRNARFAMIITDGIVTSIEVEPGGGLEVSSADAVLARL